MVNEVKVRLALEGADKARADLGGVERQLDRLTGALSRAGHYGAGLLLINQGLAPMAQAAVRAADAVTTLQNSLKLATGSTQAAGQAYEALFDIAQRSRVSFTELGATFSSISRAGQEMGISQQRLLTVTEAIGNAMTISGGSAQSMQAALVQLGQGLSSGTLRGEELNSVMEQAPRLAKALADGLGVPIGKLREMGAAGEISAQQVIAALESQSKVLSGEVTGATLTVSQAFTVLSNAAIKFTGEANDATGVTKGLADALVWVSEAITTVGKSAAVMSALRTVGEAVKVLWSDVAFVFERTGVEIGAIAAQIAAVLRGEFAQAATIRRELIADSQKARQELDKYQASVLARQSAPGMVDDKETRLLQLRTKAVKDAAQAEEDANKLRLKLAGVPDGYLKDMQEIIRLNQAGALVGKEYTDALKKQQEALLKKTGATKAAAKDTADAYAAERDAAKVWADTIKDADAAALDAAASVDGLSKSQKRLQEYLQSPAYAINTEAMRQEALTHLYAAVAAAQKTATEAASDARKAYQDQIGALAQSAQAVKDHADRLAIEEQAAALAQDQHLTLAQAIELVTIARLRDQQTAMMGNEAAVLAIQKEIDERQRLIGLIGRKDARDAAEQSARDAAAEWQKAADAIEASLTDALMRGFESGKGFLQNLLATAKNLFNTLVLRPVISAVVSPVASAVTAGLGLASSAASAGTLGSAASGLSWLGGECSYPG